MSRVKSLACLVALATAAAGCSATDALNISSSNTGTNAATGEPADAGSTTLTGQSTVGAQTGQSITAVARDARVQFAPVIGAAAEAVPPLSGRLTARAGQRGLTLTQGAEGATHIVKGYFSTITDERGTAVIFVWDVLDPAGNRLHRIQGQERVAGSAEGWPAVTSATMEAVADRTIDELAAWFQGGTRPQT
jgi:hypothetical protein